MQQQSATRDDDDGRVHFDGRLFSLRFDEYIRSVMLQSISRGTKAVDRSLAREGTSIEGLSEAFTVCPSFITLTMLPNFCSDHVILLSNKWEDRSLCISLKIGDYDQDDLMRLRKSQFRMNAVLQI